MDRGVIAICSDTHGGNRYGLLNPDTILAEVDEIGQVQKRYHPEVNKIQQYFWDTYIQGIQWVKQFAGTDPLIVIMAGDLTTGNKHAQLLVSARMADQIMIGFFNALPWYDLNPHAVRLVTGTGAHNYGHGSSEILIAEMLKIAKPGTDTEIRDHSLIDFSGIDIDVAHHGPPTGSREWLKGNEARYYLRSLMQRDIGRGKKPPRLVIRGHYHDEIEETLIVKANGTRHKSTLIIVPSFTFPDEYVRKVIKSPALVTHGMMVAEVINGDIAKIVPLTQTKDIRTKESL